MYEWFTRVRSVIADIKNKQNDEDYAILYILFCIL